MLINNFNNYVLSWAPDKKRLKRPVYQSLALELEKDITSGMLAPDTKLPPQRILADYLNINFTTVTRAYKICMDKGLTYSIAGSGTFVSSDRRSFENAVSGISGDPVDLSFISYFEQFTEPVAEAIKNVAKKNYIQQLLDYRSPSGMPHHKKAGMNWLSAYGLHAGQDQITIASGAHNSIAITFAALFKPGSAIITDSFIYSSFIELARIFNIQLIAVESDEEGMLPDELDRRCSSMPIQGIFLMPSCCNPTTVMISDRRKEELAAVIRKHQLILVENDSNVFLTAGVIDGYRQPIFNLLPENTVYIIDCGPLCTGLRVSYMVFGARLRGRIQNAVFNINVKTSSLDAEIISELIFSGAAQKIITAKIEMARKVNTIFYECFPHVPRKGHPLSLFRWLPISCQHNALFIEPHMRRHGVIVSHSDRFLSGPGSTGSYLRVSLTYARTLERLRTGLTILREQVHDLTLNSQR